MRTFAAMITIVTALALSVAGVAQSTQTKPSTAPATTRDGAFGELTIEKKKALFIIEQDGKEIVPKGGAVQLKAKAFTIRVKGDKQDVSLLPVRDRKLLDPLRKHQNSCDSGRRLLCRP